MPKFFMSEADRYACSFSMNEDDWFRKNQRMLLGIANTKFGRELLCIPQEYPQIILIKKNCVHCLISDDGTTSTVVADFRIGAKFANVIRYRWKQFNSYAKYFQLKGWQEIGKSPYILGDRVCALTLTAYPDPNTETTTVDGYTYHSGASFAIVHGAATGTSADDSGTDLYVECQNGTFQILRSYTLFDTSSLTSSASLSSATYSIKKTTRIGTTDYYTAVTTVSTGSNTSLTTSDYNISNFGSEVATRILFSAQSSGSYVDFSITTLSSISKTSITKYGLITGHDLDNTGPTGGVSDYTQYYSADTAATTSDPKLVVTYTLSSARSNFLLLSIS